MRGYIKGYNLFTILLMMMLFTSCVKPFQEKIYVQIEPNETAFVLPLEGSNKSDQKQFESVAFLNEKKVAAKRIQVPTRWHKSGRRNYNGRWIPTVRIITVDRTPITREWTEDGESGTSRSNQAIKAESKESIEFSIGVTLTAYVDEQDAARYLYYYAGKPLSEIIDLNVRSYVQGQLTKEFASDYLAVCRSKKKEIFDRLYESAKVVFAKKGITIDYIGAAGGLNYMDASIQESINKKFSAEMEYSAMIEKRKAAQEFAKAAEASKKQLRLDIELMNAQANLKRAEKWNGQLPSNIMPQSMAGAFLMNGTK